VVGQVDGSAADFVGILADQRTKRAPPAASHPRFSRYIPQASSHTEDARVGWHNGVVARE
jgi:hypothetical protein